jgi:3-phosphoshikimate 1-carboxyvinyltransferase
MTLAMMRARGCEVFEEPRTFRVAPGRPKGGIVTIEPDWSAAAFILAAARITGLALEPERALPASASLQGDAAIGELLARLDAGPKNVFDLTDVPDLIAPLTAAALFARSPTRLRGAAHTRVKESDRVAVLARELRKLGATIVERPDGLDIEPLRNPSTAPVELDPNGDHRMAMAFGVVSLECPWITVSDHACVTKSFPSFWRVLEGIRELRG